MNMMWAMVTIRWDIVAYHGHSSIYPRGISYFETAFVFICIVLTYTGILMCCTRLASLKESDIFQTGTPTDYPVMTYEHPYTKASAMESKLMITEADPSREFWEAGSRLIHEGDARFKILPRKPQAAQAY
jgi:hypothetical protein